MKKILLSASFGLVLLLGACGSGEETGSEGASTADGEAVVVTVLI